MPELDWQALAQQAESGDLGSVEAALGVKLTKKALADLKQCFEDVWERECSVASVLALVSRALQHPEGLAWERYDRRGSVLQLLAVRWKDKGKERVTVGIDANWSGRSLGGVWPTLAKWKPKLDANGELARAWARDQKQKSRVVLELTRAPAPPKRTADADEAALRAAAAEWKAGLAALAAREGLEALTLSQCEHLDDTALSVLFARKAKARWKRVHLVNPEASDALLKALLAWPGVDQLESLQINNGHFTLAGVLPLLKLPRLHTLAFTGGAWSEADGAALLRAMEALPRKHPLRRINLPGAGLEEHRRFEITTE